jgi:hypothetical protein
MPVPAPDPHRPWTAAVTSVHNDRAYPGAAGPRGRRPEPRMETRSCRVPRVVALPPADRYRQPL